MYTARGYLDSNCNWSKLQEISTDNTCNSEEIIHLSSNALVSPEGNALGEFQETTYLPQCCWVG